MKRILWYLNPKNITREIIGYGYRSNLGTVMISMLIITAVSVAMGIFYMLKPSYILLLALIMLILSPLAIVSYYRSLYSHDRFRMLKQYLRYVMTSFRTKAKISYALKEIEDLLEGEMRECVKEANRRLDSYVGSDLYEYSLKAIEDRFPNRKLKALHKLMISIETRSSVNYEESLENMRYDIMKWIDRVQILETQIASVKNNYLIAIIICLVVEGVFTFLYRDKEYLITLIDTDLFQISTFIFILAYFLIYLLALVNLHGRWLVDDLKNHDHEQIRKYVEDIRKYDPKKGRRTVYIITGIIGFINIVQYFFFRNMAVAVLVCLIMVVIYIDNRTVYRTKFKKVRKAVEMEFPIWLNSIAVTLNDRLVPLAIKDSLEDEELVIRPYVEDLVDEIEKNPIGIEPYKNFLGQFRLETITDSMKELYSLQKLTSRDGKPVTDLIASNQKMLEKSEEIRNEDNIAVIGFSVHSTQIVMMIKLVIDLYLVIEAAVNAMEAML